MQADQAHVVDSFACGMNWVFDACFDLQFSTWALQAEAVKLGPFTQTMMFEAGM